MTTWRIVSPAGDVQADSREAAVKVARSYLAKGFEVTMVDPDGDRFAVTAPVRGKGRLAFAPIKPEPVKARTSFAVYWRTREYLPPGEGDPRTRRVAAGPWNFASRWATRDEAVKAAIAAENEGLRADFEGGSDPAHARGESFVERDTSPRRREDSAVEAKIEEVEGGAMDKTAGRVVRQWRRAPGETTFSGDGSIRAYHREGDATFGGRGVPSVTIHRRRK